MRTLLGYESEITREEILLPEDVVGDGDGLEGEEVEGDGEGEGEGEGEEEVGEGLGAGLGLEEMLGEGEETAGMGEAAKAIEPKQKATKVNYCC